MTSPQQGGPPWHELTSKHFRVRTDLSQGVARDRLAQFERSFWLMNELVFPSSDPPTGRMDIIVFGRKKDYDAIGPPRTDGFFTEYGLERRPLIVMYGPLSDRARELFQHELTHRFVRHFMPRAPIWLNEGLAELYETMIIEDDHLVIGRPSKQWAFYAGRLVKPTRLGLVTVKLPTASELFSHSAAFYRSPQKVSTLYAGSWLLVSMLAHGSMGDEGKFWSYVNHIATGQTAEDAWRRVYPELPPAQLDRSFAALVKKGQIVVKRRPLPQQPAGADQVQIRAMSDDEVHTTWAPLRLAAGDAQRQQATDEIERLIARSPRFAAGRHIAGIILLRQERYSEAASQFQAALTSVPDSERSLIGLSYALHQQQLAKPVEQRDFSQLVTALEKLAQVARSTNALNTVARYFAVRGELGRAEAFAFRALKLEPGCARCAATLALIAFKQDDARKAVMLQRRAIALMPESSEPGPWLQKLRAYEQAAGRSPPKPAAE